MGKIKKGSIQVNRICSICKRSYTGYAHNAFPAYPGRCCDRCYKDIVIPSRMLLASVRIK